MSEQTADLGPEDAKLVTLARATRARARATEGAAVRDLDGRTYAAASVRLEHLSPGPLRLLTHLHISEFSRLNYGTLQNLILPHAAELVSLTHLCIEVRLTYPFADFETICTGFGNIKRLLDDSSSASDPGAQGIPSLRVVILRASACFANDLPEPSAFEKTRQFFASNVDDEPEGEQREKRILVESAVLSGNFTVDELQEELRRRIVRGSQ